uniref:Uncharacterized protein n=1 Tax=Anguilla anguilla TaxID=7936 RepID=A0A0E9RCN5_ANGAN
MLLHSIFCGVTETLNSPAPLFTWTTTSPLLRNRLRWCPPLPPTWKMTPVRVLGRTSNTSSKLTPTTKLSSMTAYPFPEK